MNILLLSMPDSFEHMRDVGKMIAYTYRGSTLRTVLGLEDQRQAFFRYKEIRKRERQYL